MTDTLDRPGDFLDGRFVRADQPDAELRTLSPGDIDDVVGIHPTRLSHVEDALESARRALPAWRRLGSEKREALLRAYQERVRHHEDAIARCIAREVGKPLWDARGEARALAGKVDLMLGEGAAYTRDQKIADLPGEIRYHPHGVVAVLGPFNFPAHLPNGQIVPALHLGNTVVFKPSEKTPNAAYWMARCFDEAGFPPGVFNVVQGGVETAKRLVDHDGVDGILFTGSVAVGKQILAQNAERPGRIVALELGGKNASIVTDDADLDRAANQIAFAAYASAGQRCTATSRVYVTPGAEKGLLARLTQIAEGLRVGHPLEEVFMGPMIDEGARERLLHAQSIARDAGYEALVSGGPLEVEGHQGWYVRPSLHRAPSAEARAAGYSHDELFGPDVAIYPTRDLEQAVALTNETRYGLAAAVFTQSRDTFEAAAESLRVGVLHWNQSSAGASGRLPFGGVDESGNHRPAGIMAGLFCAWPQAVRLSPSASSPLPSWPGFPEMG